MSDSKVPAWEIAKVEYQNALDQYRQYTSLRRQDMAFVTTVQVAVLTIIGTNLLSLDTANFLLSLISFFILLLGINNERRLTAYMAGYMRRANHIEAEHKMSLLTDGKNEVQKRQLLFSNTVIFPLYYFIFVLTWIVIWTMNMT